MLKMNALKISAILFFVVSIIYMAQTPHGFGHEASLHPPQFRMSSNAEPIQSDHPEYYDNVRSTDPRLGHVYGDSSGDNTTSASAWVKSYYASGVISGGHMKDEDNEMVYGVRIDLSASAGNSSVSGSIVPSLSQIGGIPVTHPGWFGTGQVKLNIHAKENAHRISGYYQTIGDKKYWVAYCYDYDAAKSPLDTEVVYISIEITTGSESVTESGELSLGVTGGPATASAKWGKSKSQVRNGLYAIPTKIEASLTSHPWISYYWIDMQQDKDAYAKGEFGPELSTGPINAFFEGGHNDCNGGFGYGSR